MARTPKIGTRVFTLKLSDQDIIDAQKAWKPKHADAPGPADIIKLRDALNMPEDARELICLHWLRDRFVQLRKQGLCDKHGRSKRRNGQ